MRCPARYRRDYVIEHLADDDAVLVIDETGFSQTGQSVMRSGAAYTGSAGRLRTARSASSLLRFAPRHAFIDRTLYLPKEWTDDPDRLEAHTCPRCRLATNQAATRMIARAIAASVPFNGLPVIPSTVLATIDSNYVGQQRLCARVSSAHVFRSWASDRRSPVRPQRSRTRRSSTEAPVGWSGTKGPRLHDWCYLELADLEAEHSNSANDGLWTRGLLIGVISPMRFSPSSPPGARGNVHRNAGGGRRPSMAIEDSFERENEFGLDHNESRSGMAGTSRVL